MARYVKTRKWLRWPFRHSRTAVFSGIAWNCENNSLWLRGSFLFDARAAWSSQILLVDRKIIRFLITEDDLFTCLPDPRYRRAQYPPLLMGNLIKKFSSVDSLLREKKREGERKRKTRLLSLKRRSVDAPNAQHSLKEFPIQRGRLNWEFRRQKLSPTDWEWNTSATYRKK